MKITVEIPDILWNKIKDMLPFNSDTDLINGTILTALALTEPEWLIAHQHTDGLKKLVDEMDERKID